MQPEPGIKPACKDGHTWRIPLYTTEPNYCSKCGKRRSKSYGKKRK